MKPELDQAKTDIINALDKEGRNTRLDEINSKLLTLLTKVSEMVDAVSDQERRINIIENKLTSIDKMSGNNHNDLMRLVNSSIAQSRLGVEQNKKTQSLLQTFAQSTSTVINELKARINEGSEVVQNNSEKFDKLKERSRKTENMIKINSVALEELKERNSEALTSCNNRTGTFSEDLDEIRRDIGKHDDAQITSKG